VSDADIAKQIQVLNNGFSGQEGGYPAGFTFVLGGVDLTDNADWFYAAAGHERRSRDEADAPPGRRERPEHLAAADRDVRVP